MTDTKIGEGVSDISDSYMGYVIDPVVLHDGARLHEHVLHVFHEMEFRQKYVVLLSNSIKRAADIKDDLKRMGLGPALYQRLLTSGEFLHQGFSKRSDPLFYDAGKNILLIGMKMGMINILKLII
jgi:ribonucleotide monophosphatase NagD (HAD superfamily)